MRVRSASWLLASQLVAKSVALPMSVIIARGLGPAGKGSLAVVQLVASTAVVVFNLGLGPALTYYGARLEARGRDVVRLVGSLAAVVTLVLLGLTAMGGGWFTEAVLRTSRVDLVVLGALAAGPALGGSVVLGYVIGRGSVRAASITTSGALIFQLVAYGVLLWADRLSVAAVLVVWLVATVAEAAVLMYVALALPSDRVIATPGARALFGKVWRYGLAMWAAGALGFAALRVDVYLLALYRGPAAVGVYAVAVSFAELCWLIPGALNAVMVPKVAAESEQALALTTRLERLVWPVTLAAAVGLALVAVPVIPFLFGSEFQGAVLLLALLLPGAVAIAVSSMPSAYLLGSGWVRDYALAAVCNVAVNVGLNLLLIPRMGAEGAALASVASYAVFAVLVTVLFVRRTGVSYAELLVPRWSGFRELAMATLTAIRRVG